VTTPAGAVAADADATERASRPKGKQAGGSVFSRKYGPLPGWGWALLAAGGAIAIFWWRSREESKTAPATAYTAAATGTGWANAANSLQDEISSLQGQAATSKTSSSTTKTATSKTTSTTSKPITGTTPNAGDVTVPKVEGLRANAAIAALKAKGLKYHGSPTRNPAHEYKVVSQTPAAGKKVAPGSRVDLGYQEIK
jgi:PASTA domain